MRPSNHWNARQAAPYLAPSRLPKHPEDYLRALGKRWWLVLFLTLTAGGVGTWFTLQQQPVFFASSRVLIEPPRAIVPDLMGDKTGNPFANFFNTRVQMITSREITQRVLGSRELAEWKEISGVANPIDTLNGWIEVKPVQNSNLVDVMLEGIDPTVNAKIVNLVVNEFIRYEEASLREFEQLSRSKIDSELRSLDSMREQSDKDLSSFHKEHENFLSTGESMEAARLAELEQTKTKAELQADEAKRAVERFQALQQAGIPFYSPDTINEANDARSRLYRLEAELLAQKELIKPDYYDTDPAIRRLKAERDKLAAAVRDIGKDDAELELARLKQEYQFAAMDLDKLVAEVDRQRKVVLAQQEEQQQLDNLRESNTRLNATYSDISLSKLKIDLHQSLITPRIQVIDPAQVPTSPIRPIKEIQIPLCFAGGLLFGLMLVLGAEFINQRVRRAEQASEVLGLPMLGVVPRLARRERLGRRGVFKLASQQPGSRMDETFRNLRVGMLGAEQQQPLRSLIITSPTPGEGKSLIAANLAATCARAGESVLVVDMDLRQPQLSRGLGVGKSEEGLVEVVTGELTWRNVIKPTEVGNLMVLPAGRATGVPRDILGTIEMHDLLAELCDEFDRVILDGPPLLGLADSRVVGRFADGLLLVVHAHTHKAAPLGRVRQLCDLEGLRPIGIVFNGIRYKHDDLRSVRARRDRMVQSLPAREVTRSADVEEVAEPADQAA